MSPSILKCCLMAVALLAQNAWSEDLEKETTAGDAFLIIEVEERDTDDQECSFTPPAKFTNDQNMKLEPVRGEEADCSPICEYRDTSGWTYEFYGTSDTDCGIQINNIDPKDHGDWSYISGAENGNIFITVNVIPTEEDIFFEAAGDDLTPDPKEINFRENTGVTFSCIIEGIRPAPEEPDNNSNDDVFLELEDGSSVNATYTGSEYPFADGSYSEDENVYKADFEYYPEKSHDGEALVCVVKIEDAEGGEVRGIPWNLTILASPDAEGATKSGETGGELGEDLVLRVSFTSNPEPESAEWYIPSLGNNTFLNAMKDSDFRDSSADITASGRYTTSALDHTEGTNTYSVSLTVDELEEDDEGDTFYLTVKNEEGESTISVTIRSFEDDGLSDGAIAGIVCGCIAFVVIVAVVVFFVVKKQKEKKARRSQQERIDRARMHFEQQERQMRQVERMQTEGVGNDGFDGGRESTEC